MADGEGFGEVKGGRQAGMSGEPKAPPVPGARVIIDWALSDPTW
jgi:hypothetical protein